MLTIALSQSLFVIAIVYCLILSEYVPFDGTNPLFTFRYGKCEIRLPILEMQGRAYHGKRYPTRREVGVSAPSLRCNMEVMKRKASSKFIRS